MGINRLDNVSLATFPHGRDGVIVSWMKLDMESNFGYS